MAETIIQQLENTPLKPCDLVMEGGITSGIVYPPIVLHLKESYRFDSIGGTSAGAMAAAATAAAEYGRDKQGFAQLHELQQWLKQPGNMRKLFQPSVETKPLMNLVDILFVPSKLNVPAEQRRGLRAIPYGFKYVWNWLERCIPLRLFWIWTTSYSRPSVAAFIGVLVGMIVAWLMAMVVFGSFSLFAHMVITTQTAIFWPTLIISGLICLWPGYHTGAIIGAIWKLSNMRNFYGICTGHSGNKTDTHVLTDWMSDELDKMAGVETCEHYTPGQTNFDFKPLTFGHLTSRKPESGSNEENRAITLKMITTNLSQGMPFVMPAGLKGFLFKEDDMRRLFPEYVVQHMITTAGTSPIIANDKLPTMPEGQRFHFLPNEKDLPVVVAMRLSLSFPILISAIPLYTIRSSAIMQPGTGEQQQLQESDMQLNWFSDGGICNNFPLEFFDSWLPDRPTFGINLTSFPAAAFENKPDSLLGRVNNHQTVFLKQECRSALDQKREAKVAPELYADVYLPSPQSVQDPEWQEFTHTWQFLRAIINTGLGYHNAMQANLPSYRERVVQIRLNKDEGGLNLNMPASTIEKVISKGEMAGKTLDTFDFQQHQWVRFLVMMNQLEQNLEETRKIVAKDAPLSNLLELLSSTTPPVLPYPRKVDWCKQAQMRVEELSNLIACWSDGAMKWEDFLAEQAAQEHKEFIREIPPFFFQQDAPEPRPVLRVVPEVY